MMRIVNCFWQKKTAFFRTFSKRKRSSSSNNYCPPAGRWVQGSLFRVRGPVGHANESHAIASCTPESNHCGGIRFGYEFRQFFQFTPLPMFVPGWNAQAFTAKYRRKRLRYFTGYAGNLSDEWQVFVSHFITAGGNPRATTAKALLVQIRALFRAGCDDAIAAIPANYRNWLILSAILLPRSASYDREFPFRPCVRRGERTPGAKPLLSRNGCVDGAAVRV
ncbi:MAG: hypothetical protein O6934_12865 [SAR324 cluster bacterium]|nr:hypothetical protein [SAR324 cluster bacterium]